MDSLMICATAILYTDIPSPLGTLWVAAGARGLVRVSFGIDESGFRRELDSQLGAPPRYAPIELHDVAARFTEYFAGTREVFDLPIDLSRLTPFQRSVLQQVELIPYGAVASYGDIACAIGKDGASRAVGSAVACNPVSLVIPCHRVIRSDGTPGEYGWRTFGAAGIKFKLQLLALEGVTDFASTRA